MMLPEFFVGLDLGQAADYTALAVLKKTVDHNGTAFGDVVHLERFDLGTSYPKIVAAVKAMMSRPEIRPVEHVPRYEGSASIVTLQSPHPRLIVDATGCGRAVVDMFLAAGLAAYVHPLMITAGHESREESWQSGDGYATGYYVPKKDLVGAVQAGLQTKNLKVVKALPLAKTLQAELLNFRAKITLSANEVYGAWREGQHDDLVLATAMSWWAACREDVGAAEWGPNLTERWRR